MNRLLLVRVSELWASQLARQILLLQVWDRQFMNLSSGMFQMSSSVRQCWVFGDYIFSIFRIYIWAILQSINFGGVPWGSPSLSTRLARSAPGARFDRVPAVGTDRRGLQPRHQALLIEQMPTRQHHQNIPVVVVLDANCTVRTFLTIGVFVILDDWQAHDLLFGQAGVLGTVHAQLVHQVLDHVVEGIARAPLATLTAASSAVHVSEEESREVTHRSTALRPHEENHLWAEVILFVDVLSLSNSGPIFVCPSYNPDPASILHPLSDVLPDCAAMHPRTRPRTDSRLGLWPGLFPGPLLANLFVLIHQILRVLVLTVRTHLGVDRTRCGVGVQLGHRHEVTAVRTRNFLINRGDLLGLFLLLFGDLGLLGFLFRGVLVREEIELRVHRLFLIG